MVKVVPSIAKSEEVILFADKIAIESGTITFIIEDDEGQDIPILSLAAGNWKVFYLVDPDDGYAPAGIHRWQGVTGIKHIYDQEMIDKAVKKALTENEEFTEVMTFIMDAITKREEEIAESVLQEYIEDDEEVVNNPE